jgi:hypothetical protein
VHVHAERTAADIDSADAVVEHRQTASGVMTVTVMSSLPCTWPASLENMSRKKSQTIAASPSFAGATGGAAR